MQSTYITSTKVRHRTIPDPQSEATISDCIFQKCSTYGIGQDGNGGAFFAHFDFSTPSSITFIRTGFYQCSATSSGGAVFAVTQAFIINFCCFSLCSARVNSASFAFIKSAESKFSTFSECGSQQSATAFGFVGSNVNIVSANFSQCNHPTGCSFVSCRHFNVVSISRSVFESSAGIENLAFKGGRGDLQLTSSVFYGNKIIDGQVFSSEIALCVSDCWIEVVECFLVLPEQSELFTFKKCHFNVDEKEILKTCERVKMVECDFLQTDLPALDITKEMKCWDAGRNGPKVKTIETVMRPSGAIRGIESNILPILAAFLSGFCVLYLIQSFNPPKREPGVPGSIISA